jgi:hypothetical protein
MTKTNEIDASLQGGVTLLQPPDKPGTPVMAGTHIIMPVTPVTPGTAVEQDAQTLDKTSQQRLQRHVQKLTSAAKTSFTECSPLQDQNRFLLTTNNEAKVRRRERESEGRESKGARGESESKRREGESERGQVKGKRGRKHKAEADSSVPKKVARQVEPTEAAEVWRAPVAKMY